jgi:hypothetical protein
VVVPNDANVDFTPLDVFLHQGIAGGLTVYKFNPLLEALRIMADRGLCNPQGGVTPLPI